MKTSINLTKMDNGTYDDTYDLKIFCIENNQSVTIRISELEARKLIPLFPDKSTFGQFNNCIRYHQNSLLSLED